MKTKKATPVNQSRLPTENSQSVRGKLHSHKTKSNPEFDAESAEVLANIKALLK